MSILRGDCIEVMRTLDADSIDAIVTDPPYGLSFMGRPWDDLGELHEFGKWCEKWAREAYRVLKPGGHLLAFGGSRTYHRLASGIEDAGFEIRDQLMWIYASGFPKSLDVSKAIDKAASAEREVVGPYPEARRKPNGSASHSSVGLGARPGALMTITAPATDAARTWSGWGTALKPAHEPIVLARKPFAGTVAANVQEHGTGALNIDGCRLATGETLGRTNNDRTHYSPSSYSMATDERTRYERSDASGGRWPANVVLTDPVFDDDSRFFLVPKAPRRERVLSDGRRSPHPTQKPEELIRHLVRLVTPPGGIVLDPFLGSGTLGVVCEDMGVRWLGIEREPEYADWAADRIADRAPEWEEMC